MADGANVNGHAVVHVGATARVFLTPGEMTVLRLVAAGRENARIAYECGLSERTVRNRLSTLFPKLGVQSRLEAALWAVTHGLIPLPTCDVYGRAAA